MNHISPFERYWRDVNSQQAIPLVLPFTYEGSPGVMGCSVKYEQLENAGVLFSSDAQQRTGAMVRLAVESGTTIEQLYPRVKVS